MAREKSECVTRCLEEASPASAAGWLEEPSTRARTALVGYNYSVA